MAALSILIEVCIDSVESALAAVQGGANRLELCGNLAYGGGTTPSIGLFKSVRKVVPQHIPIMAMVRPRTGSFLYSPAEFEVMLEDIRDFKQSGASGVVFGLLTASGDVDVERTKRLVAEASPLEVCFHRAFDMTRDATSAFRGIASIPGITRVLTSGRGPTAVSPSSLAILLRLLKDSQQLSLANARPAITILPGSGINPDTVQLLLDNLLPASLQEIHLSGGGWIESEMQYRREGMGMGRWEVWQTDERKVAQVRQIVDRATPSSFP